MTLRLPILFLGIAVLLTPTAAPCQRLKSDVYDNALVSFAPPPTGQVVRLDLNSGMCVTGTFVRVRDGAVTLQRDDENFTYPRHALHEESRIRFFARDYANAQVSEMEEEERSRRSLEMEERNKNQETRQQLVLLMKRLKEHQQSASVYVYVGERGKRIDFVDGTGSSLWQGSWFDPGDDLYASPLPDDKLQFYTEANALRVIPASDFVALEEVAKTLRTRLEKAEDDYRRSGIKLDRARDRLAFLSESVAEENVAKKTSAWREVQQLEKQVSRQREAVENYRKGLERFLRSRRKGSN